MAGLIDAYASAPWYLDHLRPVVEALGEDAGKAPPGPDARGTVDVRTRHARGESR